MNVNWISAASIFKIKGGTQPPKSQFIYEPRNGYIRLIQIRDFDNDSHITYVKESLSLSKCDKDDVLIGRYGAAVGRICKGLSGAYNVALVKATPLPCVCKAFLFYLLNSNFFQDRILSVSGRSAQSGFNRDDLKSIYLPLPPLPEQREIAVILGALDDKIENNRKTAATLGEMARTLYRSWFVDFDPVHARAEGRAPAHIDAATAALFPDRFGENGLPEGWITSTIGAVANIVGGSTPSTKNDIFWSEGHHAWATPKDLSKLNQVFLFDTERNITDAGLEKITSGLSPAGTVLLSSRAPIGYLALSAIPIAINQGFIAIRETEYLSAIEAYFWCSEHMDLIKSNANGSTFQEISKKNFRPLIYRLAPAPVRNAFCKWANPLFARIKLANQQSQTLATLRDTLLPRLMSGELRVSAAKEMVEEASS